MGTVIGNWDNLQAGLLVTLEIFIYSMIISTVIGVFIGYLRSTRILLINIPLRVLIEIFRGLPTLVTMFFVFFAIPIMFGLRIPSREAAIIGLSLWCISEIAEIVRGAIQSIPKGQTEAGRSLALSTYQLMVFVILPQAIRRMLPPMVGLYTRLMKGTAMAALIGVQDIMWHSKVIVERTFAAFEVFGFVMLVYFLICYPLSIVSLRLEKRLLV